MKKMLLGLSVFFAFLLGAIFGIHQSQSVLAGTEWENIWMNNAITWPGVPGISSSPSEANNYKPINGMFERDGSDSTFIQSKDGHEIGAKLTGSTKNTSAIRSTPSNRLDLSKPFEIETWIYMADLNGGADGVAFFMTGDLNQSTASNRGGEQLGVWGKWDTKNNQDAVSTALKKSFVIGFDPYVKPKTESVLWGIGSKDNHTIDEKISSETKDKFLQAIVHGYPNENQTYINCPQHPSDHLVLNFETSMKNTPKYEYVTNLLSSDWKSFKVRKL